jgi:hypothetical protein
MIQKFGFYSRTMAENINPVTFQPAKTLLISINEPPKDSSKKVRLGAPQFLPGWDKIVSVQFYDIERAMGDYKPPTAEDAHIMYEAIREVEADCENQWVVVVHCWAGISRSAAVCRFIKHYTKHHHCPALELYTPYNGLVYELLCLEACIAQVKRPRENALHLWFRHDCTPYVDFPDQEDYFKTFGVLEI